MTIWKQHAIFFAVWIVLVVVGIAFARADIRESVVMVEAHHTDGSVGRCCGVIFMDDNYRAMVATCRHILKPWTEGQRSPVAWLAVHPPNHANPYRAFVMAEGSTTHDDVSIIEFTHRQPVVATPLEPTEMARGDRVDFISYPPGKPQRVASAAMLDSGQKYRFGHRSYGIATVSGESGSPVFRNGKVVGIHWGGGRDASGRPTPMGMFSPASKVVDLMNTRRLEFTQYCTSYGCTPAPPGYRSQNRMVIRRPLLPYRRIAAANADATARQSVANGVAIADITKPDPGEWRASQPPPLVRVERPITQDRTDAIRSINGRLAALENRQSIPGKDGKDGKPGQRGPSGSPSVADAAALFEIQTQIGIIQNRLSILTARDASVESPSPVSYDIKRR